MSFYSSLLFIHIISAILGLGPGFAMIPIVKNAKNMTELRHAYFIRNRIHIFVMIGGTLLLLTGLGMGILRPSLFTTGWFVVSLILYLLALAIGPIVLSPKSRPIKELLKEHPTEEIPDTYYELAKRLFFYERIENGIFLLVIILMIIKPF